MRRKLRFFSTQTERRKDIILGGTKISIVLLETTVKQGKNGVTPFKVVKGGNKVST